MASASSQSSLSGCLGLLNKLNMRRSASCCDIHSSKEACSFQTAAASFFLVLGLLAQSQSAIHHCSSRCKPAALAQQLTSVSRQSAFALAALISLSALILKCSTQCAGGTSESTWDSHQVCWPTP